MKNIAALVIVLIATGTTPSWASAQDPFHVNGLGRLTCGKLLEATKSDFGRAQVADWLNGYITGYNFYASKPLLPPDKESTVLFASSHCNKNPLSNIVAVAAIIVQDLGGPIVKFKYE